MSKQIIKRLNNVLLVGLLASLMVACAGGGGGYYSGQSNYDYSRLNRAVENFNNAIGQRPQPQVRHTNCNFIGNTAQCSSY